MENAQEQDEGMMFLDQIALLIIYIILILILLKIIKILFVVFILPIFYFGCSLYDTLCLKLFKDDVICKKASQSRLLGKIQCLRDLLYKTPAVPLCLSAIPLSIFFNKTYLQAIFVYVVFYFLGMRQRFKNNQEEYCRLILLNDGFIRLGITLAYGLITILSFLITASGWTYNINESLLNLYFAFEDRLLHSISLIFAEEICQKLMVLGAFFIISIPFLYLASLPAQLIARYIIDVLNYFDKKENREIYDQLKESLPLYLKQSILKALFNSLMIKSDKLISQVRRFSKQFMNKAKHRRRK